MLLLMFPAALFSIGQIVANRINRKANQLPAIHENGILYSHAINFYLIRIFIPYRELKYIVFRKGFIWLYLKRRRGKYAIRIEELGEEGYDILMDLFDGTYPKGGSPKLNVYTEGVPITSQESRD
jgi:hypothetical protein